ncbi:MAG: hypothetical protein IT324_08350 [Anaerolineae bacterium]|nr:hypothetical protein [Anaerolineae bacterium]
MTTLARHAHPVAANILQRDFTTDSPNRKWLADISYIDTDEGDLYWASLEDVYSRKIVGWAMDEGMETALVEQALQMALTCRQPAAPTRAASTPATLTVPYWIRRMFRSA